MKITVIVVSTSTGCPFNRYGLYRHCLTAVMAAGTSIGWPLTNWQVLDLAVAIDNGAQHHVALDARRFGQCRINRFHALNQQPSSHARRDADALRDHGNKFRHRSQVG